MDGHYIIKDIDKVFSISNLANTTILSHKVDAVPLVKGESCLVVMYT